MKKFFVLALTLMMLCTCAFAEDVAYYFDMADVEGIEGEFVGLEEFGLQLFLPSDFVAYEPSEADVAKGVIAVMGKEDGSVMLSISHAGVADANGNLITTLEDLAAFYEASGVPSCQVVQINDLMGMSYIMEQPQAYYGMAYCTEMGTVLAFNAMAAEEAGLDLCATILTSIMVME